MVERNKCVKNPHLHATVYTRERRETVYLLGIPIDRVPTSESCVFCLGIKFRFFPHLTVSWALPVVRIIFLKRCYACN